MVVFLKKIKKWKQKRLAKRADNDVKPFWKITRYCINSLILLLLTLASVSGYTTYKKYVELRGIANIEAIKVNKNDISYQKMVDNIFVENSLLQTATQIDIDKLQSLFEKTSKNESVTKTHELVMGAWEEYSLRILLQDKIDGNKKVKQSDIDSYVKSYNSLQKLLLDNSSKQSDDAKIFLSSISDRVQKYNELVDTISSEKTLLENNKMSVHNLANSSVKLSNFENEDYSSLKAWSNNNGIGLSVSYISTNNQSLNNVVKTQYPNSSQYTLINKSATMLVEVYTYEAPPQTTTTTSESSRDVTSSSRSSVSSSSSNTKSNNNNNSQTTPSSSSSVSSPGSSEGLDDILNKALEE